MTKETLPMKYSPKWLLEKILSCGNQHGKALMYIIEFQNALASDGDLASVSEMSDSDIGKGDIPLPNDYVEIKSVKFNSDSR